MNPRSHVLATLALLLAPLLPATAAAAQRPAAADTAGALPPGMALERAGNYSGHAGFDLRDYEDRLFFTSRIGGPRIELRLHGDTLVGAARGDTVHLLPLPDGRIVFHGDTLRREPALQASFPVDRPMPAPAPTAFAPLIGEYGPDSSTVYVLERRGTLMLLADSVYVPLERMDGDRWRTRGMRLRPVEFQRDSAGDVAALALDGTVLPRRPLPANDGVTNARVTPVRPVAELRADALQATPPRDSGDFRAPDLVELRSLDPTIKYDIRYATSNNFMGTPFYTSAHAFMQRPAAEAVVRVSAALRPLGYGLLVHDAYRPWYVTKMFWDGTPPAQHEFVADPAGGSRHNRGCAVDLTLYDLYTGRPVPMTGGYDEFTDRSYADYPGGTSLQRWSRDLLRHAMEAQGFTVYGAEWWHFDYKDWKHYPILNRTFEELAGG